MIWFTSEHPRNVRLRSAVVLVGKAPTKGKRIKAFCSIVIASEGGDPTWLEDAATFVMQNGHEVKIPEIAVNGQNITMGDSNLFKKKVEAPKSDIRSFVVKQAGNKDEPDTELQFVIYMPFSGDLWRWCGQMAGETFTMQFEGATPEPGDIVAVNQPDLQLSGEPEPTKQETHEEEGDDIDPDAEPVEHAALSAGQEDAFQRAKRSNKDSKESQSSKAARAAKQTQESNASAKRSKFAIM